MNKAKEILIFLVMCQFLSCGTGIYGKVINENFTPTENIDKVQVSVLRFGAKGDGITDDSRAIQDCINYCAANKKMVFIPKTAAFYLLDCKQLFGDESTMMAPTVKVALEMRSDMHIFSNGATLKIKSGISSAKNPVPMRMFFSNDFLENISFNGLILDMNGQNNLISPNLPKSSNNFTQSQIIFSGTKANIAAGANNVLIENCGFINNAGVSCICFAQSNKPNVMVGKNWVIRKNRFFNNGFNSSDHSSIYAWANNVECYDNNFANPSMFSSKNNTGGLVAYEIHGSNQHFYNNVISNYYQGLWITTNNSQPAIQGTQIYDNKAKVSAMFAEFYNANLEKAPFYPIDINGVDIYRNIVTITDDAVNDATKHFVRIASKIHPLNVNVYNNTVIGESKTQNTAFAVVVILENQEKPLENLIIQNNIGRGLGDGILIYWGKKMDMSNIEISNNDFGIYKSLKDAHNVDVFGYGPSSGGCVKNLVLKENNKILTDNNSRFLVNGRLR
ncbi:glycosyl hydrolase family 28-related protein [Kaistella sp.]|uniref:glycosyl hydrolase family 28-related protein n=1 Tax=Kaistella sp. TaxID=2782235 RepID=UPI00359F9658